MIRPVPVFTRVRGRSGSLPQGRPGSARGEEAARNEQTPEPEPHPQSRGR